MIATGQQLERRLELVRIHVASWNFAHSNRQLEVEWTEELVLAMHGVDGVMHGAALYPEHGGEDHWARFKAVRKRITVIDEEMGMVLVMIAQGCADE